MDTQLICSWCGCGFTILTKEYKRQINKGREHFFCSRSCAAKKNNASRPDRRVFVEKTCPHCKIQFKTMTGSKSKTFCTRSCASAGSMTEKRRNFQKNCKGVVANLIPPEETLLLRESWKYVKLKSFLEFYGKVFKFEFRLGDHIFDLALPDKKTFVEFDGLYHNGKQQSSTDLKKDLYAKEKGWKIIRKKVRNNTVIEPDILYDIL